jgi:hypothetical protein
MIPPDRAGSLNGSSVPAMVECWRAIYSALVEAESKMRQSNAIHARDYSSPELFAKARVQMQADLHAVALMRQRALDVFIVWDGVPR